MTSPPPQRHPLSPVKKEDTRSPLPRSRNSALKARFEDERGGRLVQKIPDKAAPEEEGGPKTGAGPIAKARTEVPRKPGESRTAWKNRIFDHLRKKPGG